MTTPYGSGRGLLGAEHHALSSQSGFKNVERGIIVPIADHSTPFTRIDARRQRHHLSMPAVVARLCSVGRRHSHHVSPSFFRFSDKRHEKRAPGCICYRCVQSSLAARPIGHVLSRHFIPLWPGPFEHVAHGQGFDCNQPEAIYQLAGLLQDEVLTPPADALVDARQDLAPFVSFRAAPLHFGETTLRFDQLFCFFPEKSGSGNLFPGGEVCEGLESDIDPYVFTRSWQDLRLDLIAREAHKPLASSVSHNAARFDDASGGPVLHYLEMPDLGKRELALLIDAETLLWVGEGSVAGSGFIARVARCLASFHTREEGFEGFVNPVQDILQDLGVDGFIFWSDRFDAEKLGTLLCEGDALAAQPIGLFSLLQGGVVQLPAQRELLVQHACLLLGWVETVLIGFPHTYLYSFRAGKSGSCPTSTIPSRKAAFTPILGKQRLSAAQVER